MAQARPYCIQAGRALSYSKSVLRGRHLLKLYNRFFLFLMKKKAYNKGPGYNKPFLWAVLEPAQAGALCNDIGS